MYVCIYVVFHLFIITEGNVFIRNPVFGGATLGALDNGEILFQNLSTSKNIFNIFRLNTSKLVLRIQVKLIAYSSRPCIIGNSHLYLLLLLVLLLDHQCTNLRIS